MCCHLPDESFIFRELVEIRLEKIYQQESRSCFVAMVHVRQELQTLTPVPEEAEVKRQKSQTSLGGAVVESSGMPCPEKTQVTPIQSRTGWAKAASHHVAGRRAMSGYL